MKSTGIFLITATVTAAVIAQCATAFVVTPLNNNNVRLNDQINVPFVTQHMTTSASTLTSRITTTTTNRYMFSGAGSEPEEDAEREKQIEEASKAMGFSVKEYKLVLKMQEGLAKSVNALRVTGGSESKGIQVTLDGNSPANFIEFKITDDGKKLGKATVEKELVSAFKEATDAAKKGQQAAIQKMNGEIAEELKQMEGLK